MARAAASSAAVGKPRNTPKKKGAHFFKDPNIDRLLEMIMNLAAEVSVLRDRLDTHERLAAKGAYTPADVEAFDPDDEVLAAREEWRRHFLDRLLTAMEKDKG